MLLAERRPLSGKPLDSKEEDLIYPEIDWVN